MIVFDLDGTLALDHHRAPLLGSPEGRTDAHWSAYFAACSGDTPCLPLISLLDSLLWDGEHVQVWSGRSAMVAPQTGEWFAKVFDGQKTAIRLEEWRAVPGGLELWDNLNGFKLQVLMRAQPDRTPDDQMKRSWLEAARLRGEEVTLVFEDRQRVVDMWRQEGVVCCQVAPGAF